MLSGLGRWPSLSRAAAVHHEPSSSSTEFHISSLLILAQGGLALSMLSATLAGVWGKCRCAGSRSKPLETFPLPIEFFKENRPPASFFRAQKYRGISAEFNGKGHQYGK